MVIHLGLRCDIGTVNGMGFVNFLCRKLVDCDTIESYRSCMLYFTLYEYLLDHSGMKPTI
jgi:hypothetical protein